MNFSLQSKCIKFHSLVASCCVFQIYIGMMSPSTQQIYSVLISIFIAATCFCRTRPPSGSYTQEYVQLLKHRYGSDFPMVRKEFMPTIGKTLIIF
jgi:hypothetical protein